MSSTFYKQFLLAKIPKVQKDITLLGSLRVKAARRMLMKLTPRHHTPTMWIYSSYKKQEQI